MRILRISFIVLSLFFCLSGQQNGWAAQTLFFESLYDVPVMAGLSEVTEMSLSFDKVQGRIAYAAAVTDEVNEEAVLVFYREVLPQMGWTVVSPVTFTREKEKLEISFEKTETLSLVKFSLGPISK